MTDPERLQLPRDTVARIKSARPAPLCKLPAPWARMPPPTTLVRVAARYAHLWRVTVTAAAREFGLPVASVFSAWKRIYPGQPAVLCRRHTRAKASRKSAREEKRAMRVQPEDECTW